jgi:tetratricopeptide (TPR) repeat protein
MKKYILFLSVLLLVSVALLAFRNKQMQQPDAAKMLAMKKLFVAGCAPPRPEWNAEIEMPALEGWGNIRFAISTGSDSAQYFFNQGMGMFYGFHIIEALGSFKQAQKYDPESAILYWGEALAYGPNINDFGYAENPLALKAVENAIKFSTASSSLEKALIMAQSVRYDADTTIERKLLNEKYVSAMKEVYRQFPGNAEASVLYADALMQLHPWDWYSRDRQPKEWTPELVALLEEILGKFPGHPGANHYYIHASEGSMTPSKALASARRLVKSTPGLSHMVHMPSHIFNQTGFYKEGAEQNVKAVAAFKKYSSLYAPVQNGHMLYEVHNRMMEFANRLMIPDAKKCFQSAVETSFSIDTMFNNFPAPLGLYAQYIHVSPLISHVRFAEWDKALQYPAMPERWAYAFFLQQFARGMAMVHKNDLTGARMALDHMEKHLQDPDMLIPGPYFNEAAAGGKVALLILKGTLAARQQQHKEAIVAFQQAVKVEDGMMYNEPKDWLMPAGYYLGIAQAKAGQYAQAEKTFMEDLLKNPDNHWSMLEMIQALKAQKKLTEAKRMQDRYKKKFGVK